MCNRVAKQKKVADMLLHKIKKGIIFANHKHADAVLS